MNAMSDAPLYLYGIIDASTDAPDVSDWTGIKGASVRMLAGEQVAAVVSDAPAGKLRPRRRNLKAHHDTLRSLTDRTAVLPMAFGVLADNEQDVAHFLDTHRDILIEQLTRVRGHAEVTLRVRWNVEDIFDHFVSRYERLQDMRDAFFGDGASASRQEMIQLGEQFESLLQAEREAHLDTVLDHIEEVCGAIEVQDPKNESEVMNLACLVPKTDQDAFEAAVHEAAGSFGDEFLFKYTDPMAPYSFADVAFEN